MALSEHEQRVLEQIERSLYEEDPKFRATVKKSTRKRRTTGDLRIAVALGIAGLAVLVGGAWLQNVIVGVFGFLIMLAGGIIGVRASESGAKPKASAKPGSARRAPAGGGLGSKSQERLRRRFEEQ